MNYKNITTVADTSNKIVFSSTAYGQETPKGIKLMYRWLMFLSAMWMLGVEPRFTISDHMAHLVDCYLGIANIGIYFFCQYFGYKQPNGQQQPQEIANALPKSTSALNAVAALALVVLLGMSGCTQCEDCGDCKTVYVRVREVPTGADSLGGSPMVNLVFDTLTDSAGSR